MTAGDRLARQRAGDLGARRPHLGMDRAVAHALEGARHDRAHHHSRTSAVAVVAALTLTTLSGTGTPAATVSVTLV